jgi:hypothetical protein
VGGYRLTVDKEKAGADAPAHPNFTANGQPSTVQAFLSVHACQFGLFVSVCDGTSVTSDPYAPPLK